MHNETVRQEIVPQSDLGDAIKCPRCGSGRVEIKGVWERGFREVRDGDKVVESELDPTIYMNVQLLTCGRCAIEFIVLDDDEFGREIELSQLRSRYWKDRAKEDPEVKPVWVN